MVQFLGTIRPSSLSYFATYKRQLSLHSPPITAPANGFSPFRRIFNSYLQSYSATTGAGSPCEQSEIIYIGTGTSEGIPRVSCLTNPLKTCAVCLIAVEAGNRNKRLNTSILIRYPRPSGNYNILIDAGKFFYYSALQWFTAHGLRIIDAVIITHSHADAIGGLDDLRDWTNNVQPTIPIYVPQRDFEVMKKTHYYLVDTSVVLAGAAVSELQFNIIHEDPFVVQDLK
ncbi:putative hydrolase C777.06c [Malus sylvestris]|nr:putative hydrolase C777.06c [Malus domestica]XP_050137066.1 putative hydrolase C777.06c [Malus sylvestris]